MRFSSFLISEAMLHLSDDIRRLIHAIDPLMVETTSVALPDTLFVMTIQNVIDNFGAPRFIVSEKVLHEMIELGVPEFPLTIEKRQVASICLAPIWVSCVGFTQTAVVNISKAVSLLGGIFTRGFSDSVTLVIATTNASPKIFDARRNGLPIVKREWLDKCVEMMARVPLESFYLERFCGLTITSSDLIPSEHKECKKRVIAGGGKWSDVFDNEVTFMIANHLATTKKIELALAYAVPIVRSGFLDDPSRFDVINWWCLRDVKSKLFEGLCFSIHKNCQDIDTIRTAIEAHSGIIGKTPTHVLLPHGCENPFEEAVAVTPHWFWGCIDARTLLPLEGSLMYAPLAHAGPIAEINGKVFYVDSADDQMRQVLGDMIRFTGGSVVYRVTSNISYAIGCDNTKQLTKLSMELNIPVVKPSFVINLVKSGEVPDPKKHGLDGVVRTKMLRKLCDFITKSTVANEESVSVDVERSDLEDFTQEFTSTQNEVTLEVKYDSQTQFSVQDTSLSGDPLIDIMSK